MSDYAIHLTDEPIRLRREDDGSFTLCRGQQAVLRGLTRDEAHAVIRSLGGTLEHTPGRKQDASLDPGA
ncbi:hypothetical protein [Methylobacterium sp. WSM2598]|uniref:hypothetical protein n=1 Tax=Methylobacterium sp. WSM2598 TaxID=398261 RepID=UPI00036EFE17|nr:hypothetical protein [Methylobacterium sp. WSM2598]